MWEGAYIKNNYKNVIKNQGSSIYKDNAEFKTEQTKDTEHRKTKSRNEQNNDHAQIMYKIQFRCSFNLNCAIFIYINKCSLTLGIFFTVLSYPFFKSKMSLGYLKILTVVSLIII